MKDKITKITNWSLGLRHDNPSVPPEHNPPVLIGEVLNHPVKKDGTCVRTSPIVEANGIFITTRSGTKYQLCDVDPEYLRWLTSNKVDFDEKNPIKIKNNLN